MSGNERGVEVWLLSTQTEQSGNEGGVEVWLLSTQTEQPGNEGGGERGWGSVCTLRFCIYIYIYIFTRPFFRTYSCTRV